MGKSRLQWRVHGEGRFVQLMDGVRVLEVEFWWAGGGHVGVGVREVDSAGNVGAAF